MLKKVHGLPGQDRFMNVLQDKPVILEIYAKKDQKQHCMQTSLQTEL